MKRLVLFGLIFFDVLIANAGSISVNLDVTATAMYESMATTYHDGGSSECRPGQAGGRAETFEPKQTVVSSTSGNGSFGVSGVATYTMSGQIYDTGSYTPRVLNIRFDLDNGLENDVYGRRRAIIKFEDVLNPSETADIRFHCGHNTQSAVFSRGLAKGSMVLRYKVPDGVWFLKSKIRQTQHLASLDLRFNGALHTFSVAEGHLLTVKPGSILEIVVELGTLAPTGGLEGSIEWDVQPVIESKIPDKSYSVLGRGGIGLKSWPDKILESSAATAVDTFKILGAPMSEGERVIAVVARIAASKQIREQIIRDNRTDGVALMIDQDLGEIARKHGSFGSMKSNLFWEIKAAASIANYLLAFDVASQAVNFCQSVSVETVDKGRTVDVKAVKLIWYYLNGVMNRIRYYNFENYRAIFGEIKRLQTAGYSYGQVMRDEARRKGLLKAYKILTEMDLSKMPFTSAHNDVLFISRKLGSLGPSEQTMQSILSGLKDLSVREKPFVSDTMQRFLKFRDDNNEKIEISDLIERLNQMIDRQKEISFELESKIRVLSFDTASSAGATGLVDKLVTKNMSMMTDVLRETEFEAVRGALMQYQNSELLFEKAKICAP